MFRHAECAFAQARLQSRHGARAGMPDWTAVESCRGATPFIAQVRAGPLAHWLHGVPETTDPHHAEQALCERWRREVDEVARWLPAGWRDAARWFGRLAEIALAHPAAGPDPTSCPGASPAGEDRVARWRDGWRRVAARDETMHLAGWQAAAALLPRLRGPEHARDASADTERHALTRLFRRHAGTPAAAFAHLALAALELERLRGAWVERLLLEHRQAESA